MITDGIINLNKPEGITSHGCVQAVRKKTGVKRVGHTGTLDPMATGVLPICIGNAVRITEYLDSDFKKYRAEMTLGLTTETQDVWGAVIRDCREELKEKAGILSDKALEITASFLGPIEQTPPKYSAVRVGGRRLYEYARAGQDVEIKKREVFIKEIAAVKADPPNLKIILDITCGKGTYVRTICHDIGEMLGCGAAMSGLVRLESGAFKIEDAVALSELTEMNEEELKSKIKPADYPLTHFGRAVIKEKSRAEWFVNGGLITLEEVLIEAEPESGHYDHFQVREDYTRAYNIYFDEKGESIFLGVAFYDGKNEIFTADKIFFRRNSG